MRMTFVEKGAAVTTAWLTARFFIVAFLCATPFGCAALAGEEVSGPARLAYQPLEVEPQARAAFLSGRVVDGSGQPIAGAKVDAFHWYPGSETTTDGSGAFRLGNSDPKKAFFEPGGKIEVTFSAPGYTPRYIAVQPLGRVKHPVVLTQDTFLYGTVRDGSGQPVPQARVRAVAGPFEGDGVVITEVPYSTTADDEGRFKLFLQGGTYELLVLSSKGTSRTHGLVLPSGASLLQNVSLEPGVTFRAHVVDSLSGQPVPGFRLLASSDFAGTSDKNGDLQISNLYSGPLKWNVAAPGVARWWSEQAIHSYERKSIDGGRTAWQRNFDDLSFEIAPQMKPITIVAERGVRIQGRVLDPNGKPVAGATVAPALTGTGNSLTGDTRFSIVTNARGEYSGLFPAGHDREWNLIAHDGQYGEWRHWANGSSPPFKTASGQQIRNFTLRLMRPVVVTGQVVDKAGRSVSHAEVRAVQADRRGNRYYDPTVETDARGRFVLRFVGPGRHFIQVAPFWLLASEAPSASSKTLEVRSGHPADAGTLTQVTAPS